MSLPHIIILYRKLSPSNTLRSKLLAVAISKLLWRCGEEKRAVLALPGDTSMISGAGRYKPDGITERVSHYVPPYLFTCIPVHLYTCI